jgi:hypothetical protein
LNELELSKVAVESCLHIAQDEVAMLENELKRIKDENLNLRAIIQRSDKIIYGSSKASFSGKENSFRESSQVPLRSRVNASSASHSTIPKRSQR